MKNNPFFLVTNGSSLRLYLTVEASSYTHPASAAAFTFHAAWVGCTWGAGDGGWGWGAVSSRRRCGIHGGNWAADEGSFHRGRGGGVTAWRVFRPAGGGLAVAGRQQVAIRRAGDSQCRHGRRRSARDDLAAEQSCPPAQCVSSQQQQQR